MNNIVGPTFNEIFTKKRFVSPMNNVLDPLTDRQTHFLVFGRDFWLL